MLPKSPFTQYFGTNYVPSVRDIQHINDILVNPLKCLQELDKQISQLQAERETIQTFVDNHRAILSSSRRLPSDIWRLIFIQCLPPSEFAVCTITEAPLLLTGICHLWRELALSTPGLWNSIHFNVPAKPWQAKVNWYTAKMQARRDGIMRWLNRSGSLPLRLSMSAEPMSRGWEGERGENSQQFHDDIAKEFAALLRPHSPRWHSLSFNGVPRSVLETLTLEGNMDVSLLRRIQGQAISQEILYGLLMKPAGKISLCIDRDFPLFARTHPKTFRWDCLSELHITSAICGVPSHVIAQIAEMCPHMITCNLKFHGGPDPEIPHQNYASFLRHPIEWKHLHRLDVALPTHNGIQGWGTGPDNIRLSGLSGFFDVITTPALTHFSIAFFGGIQITSLQDGANQEHPFHEFLIRSGCSNSLTHLGIDIPIRAELLLQSLTILTSLTSLKIGPTSLRMDMVHAPYWDGETKWPSALELLLNEEFFHALASTTICPLLDELTFLHCSSSDVNINALLDLAHSRRLKAFLVTFGEQPISKIQLLASENVKQSLEQLKLKGMKVGWDWTVNKTPPLDDPYYGLLSLTCHLML